MKATHGVLSCMIFLATAFGGWQVASFAQSKKQGSPKQGKKKKKKEADPRDKPALFHSKDSCDKCHVESGWFTLKKPSNKLFDHSATGFALEGGHKQVKCAACHRKGLAYLSRGCYSCHKDPHAGANSYSCEQCHSDQTWNVPRNFFSHENTRFPLTGVHASQACEDCHRPARGEALAITSTECGVCHIRDRARATPNHIAAGFTQCSWCHTTTSFKKGSFTHRTYVLAGAHVTDCANCHTGTVFAGLASGGTNCRSCHQAEFDSTLSMPTVPNHTVGSAFDTNCDRCHDNANPPLTFQGATIR